MILKKYIIIIYLIKLSISETCINPILNCQDCDSQGNCTICISGYHLNQQICNIDILNCATYNLQQNTSICDQCQNNYALQDNLCYLKIDNCLQYTQQQCIICNLYYVSNGSYCLPWIQNCQNYTSTSTPQSYMCEQCQDTYYLSQNTCQQCSTNFFGCLDCTPTYCLQCMQSYYLDIQYNYCQTCPIGCLQCMNIQTCTNCIDSYYINYQICIPCNQSIIGCISCNQSLICDKCGDGYYKDTNNQCIQCTNLFQSSFKCNSITNLECQPYYFLYNNNCLFCSQNCIKCESQIKCIQCKNDTIINQYQCFTYDSGLVQLEWVQTPINFLMYLRYQLNQDLLPQIQNQQYFCQYQIDCQFNGTCKKNYCECNFQNFGLRCQFSYNNKDQLNFQTDTIINFYMLHNVSLFDKENCTTLGLFFLNLVEISPIFQFEKIFQISQLIASLSQQCNTQLQLIDTIYILIEGISINPYISFLDKQAANQFCINIISKLKSDSIMKIQPNHVQQYISNQVQINLISIDAKNNQLLNQIYQQYLQSSDVDNCDYVKVLKTPTLFFSQIYLKRLQSLQINVMDQIRFYSENNFYTQSQINTATVNAGFFFSNATSIIDSQDFVFYLPKRDLVNRYSFYNFKCLQWNDQQQIWKQIINPIIQNCQNYIICHTNQLGTVGGQLIQNPTTTNPLPTPTLINSSDKIADQAGFAISMGLFWSYIFFSLFLIKCYFKYSPKKRKNKKIIQEMQQYLPPRNFDNDQNLSIKQKMELQESYDSYQYSSDYPLNDPIKPREEDNYSTNIWMIFPIYNITHTQQLGHRFQKLSFLFINMLIFLTWTCLFIGKQTNPTLGQQILYTVIPLPLTWIFSYVFSLLCQRLRWGVEDRFTVNPIYWIIHIIMFSGLGCLNTYSMYDSTLLQDKIVIIAFFLQLFVDLILIDLLQIYISYLILRQNEDSYIQLVKFFKMRGYID